MQKIISLFLLSIFYNFSYACDYNCKETINQEIQKTDSNINIGIKIRNLLTGDVIYERNADRYYTFASALKFITIGALNQYFGNDYLFINKILQNKDDYYLEINDPNFSTSDLDSMINMLKEKSHKTIANFYIINSQFSLPAVIESGMLEDSKRSYGAPITQVHINKNYIKLQLYPNELVKNKLHVNNQKLIPYKIVNKAITIPNADKNKLNIVIKDNNLLINGTLNEGPENFIADVVVDDNLNHIKLTLQQLLNKHNIKITGKILYSSKPKLAKEIVQIKKNFNQIGSYALKMSDNYITDYLLAKFATICKVSDWAEAGLLLKKYVNENFAVNLDNTVIVDGSGLSRYNLLTPTHFDEFLTSIYKDKNFETIKLMLARPNEPGTLEKRFQGVNIFAKTGTMSGVSSLIGYVFDKNNVPYSFVIVSNNYLGPKLKYANLEEEIIRILLNNLNSNSN